MLRTILLVRSISYTNNIDINELDLCGNMIESFPMALATLPLSTLLLSQNQLKTIPNAPFETLKTLVLNGVGWDIQTLGSALAFFPNLKEIHFRDNNVTDLDINWSNIEVINIAGNKLTKWSQVQHLGKIQT